MTAQQAKDINDSLSKFFAAELNMTAADTALVQADNALVVAKADVQTGAPARAKAIIDASNVAFAVASADRQDKFQSSSDAHVATNVAQTNLNEAITASLQTPVVEAV